MRRTRPAEDSGPSVRHPMLEQGTRATGTTRRREDVNVVSRGIRYVYAVRTFVPADALGLPEVTANWNTPLELYCAHVPAVEVADIDIAGNVEGNAGRTGIDQVRKDNLLLRVANQELMARNGPKNRQQPQRRVRRPGNTSKGRVRFLYLTFPIEDPDPRS